MSEKKSELEKLENVKEKSQAICEFLEWIFNSKNYHIARYLTKEEYESEDNIGYVESNIKPEGWKRYIIKKDELIMVHINIEKLLAEYFEIDLAKVEEERREILKNIKYREPQRIYKEYKNGE